MKSVTRRNSCDNETGETGEVQGKKIKLANDCLINQDILDSNIQENFSRAFRSDKDFVHDENDVCLHTYPFKHCVMQNFVKDEDYLKHLKEELLELEFLAKSNDLYKFFQSNDLKTSKKESISKLRKLLYKDCLDWIRTVTNIPLDENAIDMSCAKYTNTDVLLCHDDELEGRRVAYIFYLVPTTWTQKDGGSLDLFDIDDFGQPDKIAKSLVPEWNSLVFFEVTPVSFHQVSEVLSDKTRLSISGWFHGPPIDRPSPHKELPPARQFPLLLKDEILISWINPIYLQPDIVSDIRESFEENSEIELKDFLLKEKYEPLVKELKKEKFKWQTAGPANKRRYDKASDVSLAGLVQECFQMFKSEPMFKLLTTFTGLKLSNVNITEQGEESDNDSKSKEETAVEEKAKQDNEKSSSCYGNVCRWSHGYYTLIHDKDPEASEMALDALFFLGCDGWEEKFGGYTSYVAKEEDEEARLKSLKITDLYEHLLTIYPCSNSLALVYRDTDTLKFVKHINNSCKTTDNNATSSNQEHEDHYFDIMCTYFE